jgi:hypothetical protein
LSSPIFAAYYIPGLNVAFIFSLILTIAMTLVVIPLAKRRPVGKPLTWAEANIAAVWAFGVLFLAYGVVPHQWITHADSELGWRRDKLLTGPVVGDKGLLEYLPIDITYEAIRDIIVVVIYVVFLGLQIYVWIWWQNRGKKATPALPPSSSYGRPLVRKG